MKVWYYGVCDEHMEAMTIYVSNPGTTGTYLSDFDVHIQAYLERHYGCSIKLVHLDEDLDKLWANYTVFEYQTGEPRKNFPQPGVCTCKYTVTVEEPERLVRIHQCPTCNYKETYDEEGKPR